DTTINFSQEICVVPDDRIAPCKPVLTVENNCEEDIEQQLFTNKLEYDLPDSCEDLIQDLDVVYWFRPFGTDSFQNISQESNLFVINENNANHSSSEGFAGCYRIQMVDQFGNVGPFSDTV